MTEYIWHCDACDRPTPELHPVYHEGGMRHVCRDCLREHIAQAVQFIGGEDEGRKGGETGGDPERQG